MAALMIGPLGLLLSGAHQRQLASLFFILGLTQPIHRGQALWKHFKCSFQFEKYKQLTNS